MATASRPESQGKIEIESADDFILASETQVDQASFTGLLFHGGPGEIRQVRVEIYRVFPKDSNVGRTSDDPDDPPHDAFPRLPRVFSWAECSQSAFALAR